MTTEATAVGSEPRVLMYASTSGWAVLLPGPKSKPRPEPYWVEEIAAAPEFGRGFLIRPIFRHQEPYQLTVGPEGVRCTCPGFLHRGACRHADGLGVLVRDGKLTRPLAE